MRSLATSLVCLALLLVGQAHAGDGEPAVDLAALQGRWKAWSAQDQFFLFEVRGKAFTLTQHTGGKAGDPWSGSLVIDEVATPKRLTWTKMRAAGRDLPDNQCI